VTNDNRSTTVSRAPWVDLVTGGHLPRPTVLLIGGFLTAPPAYRPFVQRLRDRGVDAVVVANVWTPDWLLASRNGMGPILTRASRALLTASVRANETSLGAPVLVVGHSAGGMVARLLTSPVPYQGRPLNGSRRIGAIVTLGTPHLVTDDGAFRNRVGAATAAFANATVPGPFFAPGTGYLAVASRIQPGRPHGDVRTRAAWFAYQGVRPDPEAAEIAGDGLVPLDSALLPGAPSLVFDDAAHGQSVGRDWYGSDRFLDRWWPLAIGAWASALRARAEVVF
jgi:hypothetical protein